MRAASGCGIMAVLAVLSFGQTTAPRITFKTEPEYSEEARRAQVNARVSLGFLVGLDGVPKNLSVTKGAGFGLDAESLRAVAKWRFEPAMRSGQPYEAPANVEVSLRLMDSDNVLSRLSFLPPQSAPPRLLEGRIPRRGTAADGEKIQVEFEIGTDGIPTAFHVGPSSRLRSNEVMEELVKWRFTLPSQPVHAVLEMEAMPGRGSGPVAPVRSGGQPITYTRIDPTAPQDLTLSPPILIAPADQADFDVYPRTTRCSWKPLEGAAAYLLQWDYYSNGAWNSEAKKMGDFGTMTTATELAFDFVGAQPGRWRVWPFNAKGERGVPSEWRVFRYSK